MIELNYSASPGISSHFAELQTTEESEIIDNLVSLAGGKIVSRRSIIPPFRLHHNNPQCFRFRYRCCNSRIHTENI